MKLHDVEQGSMEWALLRAGIPTASEMSELLTPRFVIRKGDMPDTYLNKKVAEKWQGGPLPQKQVYDMEQGQILEAEALNWYSLAYDVDVTKVGFITTDDGRAGCSPDFLLTKDCGGELKCPKAETHVGYLRDGVLPDAYVIQVHTSLFVTGFQQWKFVSYRRGFPQFVLTVDRDEKTQAVIAEALDLFTQKFDEAMALMTEINGGPPPRLKPLTPMPAKMPTLQRTTTQLSTLHELEIVP